jgi:preprotein translocase subunit SecD
MPQKTILTEFAIVTDNHFYSQPVMTSVIERGEIEITSNFFNAEHLHRDLNSRTNHQNSGYSCEY